MYKRLPMGICAAPDLYQRAMSELFSNIKSVEIAMDDILIHAPTAGEHDKILVDILKKCENNNLKLNREKTNIGKDQVEYIGVILSRDGLKISNKRIESIKNCLIL